MSNSNAKSLAELIGTGKSPLGKLAGEAKRRADLSDYLRKALPPALSEAIVHCNIEPVNTITVLAPTSEWAARLRFATPEILAAGRKREPQLEQVRVRVAPDPRTLPG
jgi:hypothetical protein